MDRRFAKAVRHLTWHAATAVCALLITASASQGDAQSAGSDQSVGGCDGDLIFSAYQGTYPDLEYGIWRTPPEGGAPNELLSAGDHHINMGANATTVSPVSPDGKWLAFAQESDVPADDGRLNFDTWALNLENGEAHDVAPLSTPREWTDDSRHLLAYRRSGDITVLVEVPSGVVSDYHGVPLPSSIPKTWTSPDGRFKADIVLRALNDPASIWITDLATQETILQHDPPGGVARSGVDVAWAPASPRLAYSYFDGTHWSVRMLDIETGASKLLSGLDTLNAGSPVWLHGSC